MQKLKTIISALAAVAGIGGAYATTDHFSVSPSDTVYNWYTPGGSYTFSGPTNIASNVCPSMSPNTCLIGTSPGERNVWLYRGI